MMETESEKGKGGREGDTEKERAEKYVLQSHAGEKLRDGWGNWGHCWWELCTTEVCSALYDENAIMNNFLTVKVNCFMYYFLTAVFN